MLSSLQHLSAKRAKHANKRDAVPLHTSGPFPRGSDMRSTAASTGVQCIYIRAGWVWKKQQQSKDAAAVGYRCGVSTNKKESVLILSLQGFFATKVNTTVDWIVRALKKELLSIRCTKEY